MLFDNFSRPDRNPWKNPTERELWHAYRNDPTEGPDDQKIWWRNPRDKLLHISIRSGNMYLYCLNHEDQASRWHLLSEVSIDRWELSTYTQLLFSINTPRGLNERTDGGFNLHVGTYARGIDEEYAQEDKNRHYYYYGNIWAGMWNNVEVDLIHPSHQRNIPTREWGLIHYLDDTDGKTWMADRLTSFYIDVKKMLRWYPAQYSLGEIQLRENHPASNILDIYNVVWGVKGDRLYLSWSGRRDRLGQVFSIRYCKSSMHLMGWETGDPIIATGNLRVQDSGYNAVQCSIPWKQGQQGYVGIKPDNISAFREILVDTARATRRI